jgi:hypothetical protein
VLLKSALRISFKDLLEGNTHYRREEAEDRNGTRIVKLPAFSGYQKASAPE